MSEKIDRVFEENASAAQRYSDAVKNRQAEIVDVTVPSGFVFKFEKPSKFGMLFGYGVVPQTAASGAVQAWIDQGLIEPGSIDENTAKNIDEGIKLRDRVLELSRQPKLVIGEPANENELDARTLSDEDAAYLLQWVAAGGDTSAMLGKFPVGREPDALASANGSPVRGKGKRTRKHPVS